MTGIPGTGKSHFAKRLSRFLGNAKLIEINEIVEKKRLFSGVDEHDTKIVKMRPLEKELKSRIAAFDGPIIIVGHLAADLNLHYDIAVVTRARLSKLARVFKRRGYAKSKSRTNLFAEALDYCGANVEKKTDELYEVENESDKRKIMLYMKARIGGRNPKRPEARQISRAKELISLIHETGINP